MATKAAKKIEEEVVEIVRPIRAVYYDGKKEAIQTNAGKYPRTMVLHALDHLQLDSYGARVVEVIDISTGELHAVMSRTLRKIEVLYKREPKEYDQPMRKPE